MELTPIAAVVVIASVLGGGMAIPQARKLQRSRCMEGVSITWAAIGATVNAWWAAYGLATGDLGIVPVSAVSVMAYVTIATAIVRLSPDPMRASVVRSAASGIAVSTVPVAALVIEGWLVAGIVLGALYGVQLAPAVVAVYRAVDVGGVSLATWVLAFIEAALWGVYGFAGLDVGIMTLAATGIVMSALVLARLFVRRPRRSVATAYVTGTLAPA